MHRYEVRDYAFGDRALALRERAGLTQQELATHVTAVFWRSLHNALPFDEWLDGAIRFLAAQQQARLPENVDARVSILLCCGPNVPSWCSRTGRPCRCRASPAAIAPGMSGVAGRCSVWLKPAIRASWS
ncbi:MAG TPA: hypothetical protein VHB98_06355 [Chloroflexota bacterium]|nr:hypothetical protein [Chloroflexota bacterium]